MARSISNSWASSGQRAFAHVAFWLAYLALSLSTLASVSNTPTWAYLLQVLALPLKMLVVYGILWVLVPHILFHKRLLLFLLSVGGMLVLGALLQRAFLYSVLYQYVPNSVQGMWNYGAVMGELLRLMMVVALAGFLKLLRSWYMERLRSEQLDEEKTKAELDKLRSQVHPHFLFNTLNNIYALSLQGGRHASENILRLSNFLREIVYVDEEKPRPLTEELEVLDNYIALEQLRFGRDLQVNRSIQNEAAVCCLPPLLLLPLVENAFKHGLSKVQDEPNLHIEASFADGVFRFFVRNSKPEEAPESSGPGGQGQQNIADRLRLHFGDKATFTAKDLGLSYESEIRIFNL